MRLWELFESSPTVSHWRMVGDQPNSDGAFARPLLKGWRLEIHHIGNGVVHLYAWHNGVMVDSAEDYEETNLHMLQRDGLVKPLGVNEDGRIVRGVNTTCDVGVDEIIRQAAKFGNAVDRDGRPLRELMKTSR